MPSGKWVQPPLSWRRQEPPAGQGLPSSARPRLRPPLPVSFFVCVSPCAACRLLSPFHGVPALRPAAVGVARLRQRGCEARLAGAGSGGLAGLPLTAAGSSSASWPSPGVSSGAVRSLSAGQSGGCGAGLSEVRGWRLGHPVHLGLHVPAVLQLSARG